MEFSVLLGIKGAGEAGCAGALPAVMNAIVDALSVFGISGTRGGFAQLALLTSGE